MKILTESELMTINGGGDDYIGYALILVVVVSTAFVCPPAAITLGAIMVASDLIGQRN